MGSPYQLVGSGGAYVLPVGSLYYKGVGSVSLWGYRTPHTCYTDQIGVFYFSRWLGSWLRMTDKNTWYARPIVGSGCEYMITWDLFREPPGYSATPPFFSCNKTTPRQSHQVCHPTVTPGVFTAIQLSTKRLLQKLACIIVLQGTTSQLVLRNESSIFQYRTASPFAY